ncbi:MAG TPA: hypothetical protein EYQ26_07300 [Rhodospirillales bacterium]|nr:hypothetical protein [Rhodospirillales bacterium]
MKLFNIFFLVFLMLTLIGCASNPRITLHSNPQGASIYCQGELLGEAPQTRKVPIEHFKGALPRPGDCAAVWVSGKKVYYQSQSITKDTRQISATAIRPRGEGYAQDAAYAMHLRQIEQARQAAEQQAQAARAAEAGANRRACKARRAAAVAGGNPYAAATYC